MVVICVKTAGSTLGNEPPMALELASASVTVGELVDLIHPLTGIPTERLRIVFKGKALTLMSPETSIQFISGDAVVAVAGPPKSTLQTKESAAGTSTGIERRSEQQLRQRGVGRDSEGGDSDSDGSDVDDDPRRVLQRMELQNYPVFDRKVAAFLLNKGVPHMLVASIFLLQLKTYLAIVVWYFCLRFLHLKFGHGPILVLMSMLFVIMSNLGRRQPGQESAYTIFNGFRALPGQLDADDVDRAIRRG